LRWIWSVLRCRLLVREVRVYEGSGEVCGVLGVLGVLYRGIRLRDLEVLAVIHWVGRNRHSLISSQASQLSLFTQQFSHCLSCFS